MSERPLRINSAPGLNKLVKSLTKVAYSMDAEFRTGESDCFETMRASKKFVGLVDDYDTSDIPVYDERWVTLSAERTVDSVVPAVIPLPDKFTVKLDIITQLDSPPPTLHRQLAQEEIGQFEFTTLGDLQQIEGLEYNITKESGLIDITRNISYQLSSRDHGFSFFTEELPQTDDDEETDSAQPSNFVFSKEYDQMLEADLKKNQDIEAIVCIDALLKAIKSGDRIPDVLHNVPKLA